MWPYWLMFLVPVWATLSPGRLKPLQATLMWVLVGILFALMMGFRHEVGGDWSSYSRHFALAATLPFTEIVQMGDPGYYALNWVVGQLGGDIYYVNFACAGVMMWGTVVFCRSQPNPWLALVAAVPYMLVVVGMGYTRQSVALGFALLGLTALGHARLRHFLFCIAIGATFHKSAILLLPIAALAGSRHRLLTLALVAASSALLYYLLLADSTEQLWANYVESESQSQGGLIRVLMNVLPALLFIFFNRRLAPDPNERRLWIWMAVFAMVCLPLVGLASTAVDRVALYLIPVQLFVFARMPRLARTVEIRTPIVLAVVGYYAAVLFVWLNYAAHAFAWVPYQFLP